MTDNNDKPVKYDRRQELLNLIDIDSPLPRRADRMGSADYGGWQTSGLHYLRSGADVGAGRIFLDRTSGNEQKSDLRF